MAKAIDTIIRHSMVMTIGTFASRILGLIRETIIAAFFGATRQLDAFLVAYTLANLARQILAEGALSATFVPVFSRALSAQGETRAKELGRQALTLLIVIGLFVVCLGIILSPQLVSLIAPGFSGEEAALAVSFTKRLFPFLLIISLSALVMGVLNSLGSFFVPAVAPAVSNVVFIVVVLFFYEKFGISALPVAVLAGGVSQFCVQWIWSAWRGFVLYPTKINRADDELKTMMRLFLPYVVGLSFNQLHPIISRVMGSFLEAGSISVLNYADRLLQLPLGLFVIAISQAVLPTLSKVSSNKDEFVEIFRDSLRFSFFLILPISIMAVIFSPEAVNCVFYRGAFDDWAWRATSQSLAIYSLGLLGMALTNVTLRAIYACGLPKGAMLVTSSTVVVNFLISASTMRWLSYRGLALGVACAFTSGAFLGISYLAKATGKSLKIFNLKWCAKLALSACLLVLFSIAYKFLLPYPFGRSTIAKALWLIGAGVLGVSVYGFITLFCRLQEWKWIIRSIKGED